MDFELVTERGAATPLAEAPRLDAGGQSTPGSPAAEQGRVGRMARALRESIWLPVVLRVGGIAFAMLGLAGIGAASILAAPPGTKIAGAQLELAQSARSWLAPPPAMTNALPAHMDPVRGASSHGGAACGEAELCAGDAGAPSAGITPDGKVILNRATVDDLTRLPGVGRRRAEAIVELRNRLKRFRKATDLLRVRGIGPRGLKRMLPHLVVDPPPDTAPTGQ